MPACRLPTEVERVRRQQPLTQLLLAVEALAVAPAPVGEHRGEDVFGVRAG
jgi:hypothetical protein